jgi:hypothetical protein
MLNFPRSEPAVTIIAKSLCQSQPEMSQFVRGAAVALGRWVIISRFPLRANRCGGKDWASRRCEFCAIIDSPTRGFYFRSIIEESAHTHLLCKFSCISSKASFESTTSSSLKVGFWALPARALLVTARARYGWKIFMHLSFPLGVWHLLCLFIIAHHYAGYCFQKNIFLSVLEIMPLIIFMRFNDTNTSFCWLSLCWWEEQCSFWQQWKIIMYLFMRHFLQCALVSLVELKSVQIWHLYQSSVKWKCSDFVVLFKSNPLIFLFLERKTGIFKI